MINDSALKGKIGASVVSALQPITFQEASVFITQHDSHLLHPIGWQYGIAVNDGSKVVGVITVERPVAPHLNNGWTLEVTRCCTDSTPHVASKLYAAAWRAAKALGYRRLVTYLPHEADTSLTPAGWRVIGKTKGRSWDCPARPRVESIDKAILAMSADTPSGF